ncbi:hypothetical protein V2J09_019773 [Rumex salicifolius]
MAVQRSILVVLVLISTAAVAVVQAQNTALPPVQFAGPPPSIPTRQEINQLYTTSVLNFTNLLVDQLNGKAGECISDPTTDWNVAFNYSANGPDGTKFLGDCMEKYGDVPTRMCSKAEVNFYLQTLINQTTSGNKTYLKPNINCNSSGWISGCEPGWGCSISSPINSNANAQNSTEIPSRTFNCQPCCNGFFCPQGLTCMLRKYNYQLPPGRNHTCGGANVWGGIQNSKEIFCPAGSYCPTTTTKKDCSNGYYCMIGSTSQNRCSKLAICEKNADNQHIQTYGGMLIVCLIILLLIIYNCSDHIISIRERRRAKSREKAVKLVQESEDARSRWKVAKNAARKLQSSLSRKASRTSSSVRKYKMLDEINRLDSSSTLPPLPPRHTSSSRVSSLEVDGNSVGSATSSHSIATQDEIHDESSSHGNVHKSSKKSSKPKEDGDTQIFMHVYSQIAKEKSREKQKEKLNLARVISIATNTHVQKRPMIEIAFKDLNLKLKGKQKYFLRNLNGRITPGRIAAVMGPSGAGKTSFLTALAGKTIGCTTSGLILINGVKESIHSYRKIVGFVPQDDIVHGDLTVEENLWFSATCRLSADLPKEDKILVLERVIENLGLQEIRDSLVGTVEKRGISGGQRKRVNVGLELVMEPSLLFLDEPTSGLDSSSSRLLLQALRHEAQAGVNIAMVVHQPSYSLFQMFDDLVLLAKGGLMAYQGPISRVEEYFESMGIKVPDRINPPDFYIDILEGLADPGRHSSVNYKQLPIIWMLRNGYPIPENMKSDATNLDVSGHSASPFASGRSFNDEWQDNSRNAELRKDQSSHNLFESKDLSNRRTPSRLTQYKYYLGRISKQRLREASIHATDYGILFVAGACLGTITKIGDGDFGAALLCQIASLRTFSLDKLQYWRESASGISSLAHFLAKDTVDHFNTLLKPVVYLSMYYFFTSPRSSFLDNYIILLSLVYCVTGMGYAFAIFFEPGPAQLFSVLVPVCLTLISGQSIKSQAGPIIRFIADLSYPKWALEACVIANAKRYYGVWLIQRCTALMMMRFNLHDWTKCIFIIFLFGFISRILAFAGMLALRRR